MKKLCMLLAVAAIVMCPMALGGCKKKEAGTAEKAGQKADDAMKKAADDLGN
jgi:hypothetical protein